jgi:hypothetical protein
MNHYSGPYNTKVLLRMIALLLLLKMIFTPSLAQNQSDLEVMLVYTWPAFACFFFILIVLFKANVASSISETISWESALVRTTLATAASTFIGVPLLLFLIVGSLGDSFLYRQTRFSIMLLILTFFFASVYIERWVFAFKSDVQKSLVALWSWKANFISYGLILSLMAFFYEPAITFFFIVISVAFCLLWMELLSKLLKKAAADKEFTTQLSKSSGK